MSMHDISRLETAIKDLQGALKELGTDNDLEELLMIIHRPGWTTPQEAELVHGVVSYLTSHAQAAQTLKTTLMSAARNIGRAGNSS
ncbi:MAG: hypothetical protein ABIZ05_03805 [Pseudonocardiaceae bacterium]